MTGYNYEEGMSNNAMHAYALGIKPLSQITADDLKAAGWRGTKRLAVHLTKVKVWPPCEWHHSGGTWYNKVDFYDPAELIEVWDGGMTESERTGHIEACKAPKAPEQSQRVTGRFAIWGGSRKRPKLEGYQIFTGTKVGDWIELDGGGKKKATGNHIEWRDEK